MWRFRLPRMGLGLLGLSLLGLGVAYVSGTLPVDTADPSGSEMEEERKNEWWENLEQHAGTVPVWFCPSHPQHSWGVTVGGSYVGLDVFTDHSVVWMSGYDRRIPFALSPRWLWTGLLGSGAIVGSLLISVYFRYRSGFSSRSSRVPG